MAEITEHARGAHRTVRLAKRHTRLQTLMDEARKIREAHERGEISADVAAEQLSALASGSVFRRHPKAAS